MKHVLVFSLVLSSVICNAQITITSNDFPELGDENRVMISDFSLRDFPFTLEDLDDADTFSLDISEFFVDSIAYQNLVDPASAAGGDDIEGAEMAFNTSLGVTFAKTVGDSLMVVGVTPVLFDLPSIVGFGFDEPATYYTTPMSFDSAMSDSASTKQDLGIFTIHVKLKMDYVVNGHGRVKTSEGWFNVIRLQRRFEFIIKTVPIIGDPFEQKGLYVNWEFLTEDEKWPLVKFSPINDDFGGGSNDTIMRVEVLFTDRPTARKQYEELKLNIQTRKNGLVIYNSDYQGQFECYGVDGKLHFSQQMKNGERATFALPRGISVARLTLENGEVLTKNIFIE
ncbi:MAG: hypothetical protein JXQ87_07840 [Bacteroidia bacterium]